MTEKYVAVSFNLGQLNTHPFPQVINVENFKKCAEQVNEEFFHLSLRIKTKHGQYTLLFHSLRVFRYLHILQGSIKQTLHQIPLLLYPF